MQTLAEAVAKARDGDTIHLAAGSYFECAGLGQRDLVLEGEGPETVLTDKPCEGKAVIVAHGDNLTVRNLVLARARVPDMNGAGIRLEGQGLTVDHVVFENDQVGVLAGMEGVGEIRVSDCTFHAGGVAGERPSSALSIGRVGRLVVERSRFLGVKGTQISTGAVVTELTGNRIETGVEVGAGAAVVLTGGRLAMRDNVVAVGPNAPPRDAAVLALDGTVEARGNVLENTTGRGMVFLLDWTHGNPVVSGNTVGRGDTEVGSGGVLRHRVGGAAREAVADIRSAGGALKQVAKRLLGR